MMRAGSLDRRVTIRRRSLTSSGSGEPIETWTNVVVRRPASMWPVRGDERIGGPQEIAKEQVEFRIRYSADVAALSPLDQIIHPALTAEQAADLEYVVPTRSIHDVLAVHEIGRRVGLKIITERRADA